MGPKGDHGLDEERYEDKWAKFELHDKGLSGSRGDVERFTAKLIFQREGRPRTDGAKDRKSTRLNSSHSGESRMPSSA